MKFCISKGFNTGVVLFDLERMRQSAEYNGFLEAEEVARVMNKYGYHVSLGDQDWFTNIGFEVSCLILNGKFDRFYFSLRTYSTDCRVSSMPRSQFNIGGRIVLTLTFS